MTISVRPEKEEKNINNEGAIEIMKELYLNAVFLT